MGMVSDGMGTGMAKNPRRSQAEHDHEGDDRE